MGSCAVGSCIRHELGQYCRLDDFGNLMCILAENGHRRIGRHLPVFFSNSCLCLTGFRFNVDYLCNAVGYAVLMNLHTRIFLFTNFVWEVHKDSALDFKFVRYLSTWSMDETRLFYVN